MTLLDHLATVPDPRRAQGRRHSLPPLLAACLMAVLTGHYGYRPIARFLHHNASALRQHLPFSSHALPSHVTVRDVLQRLDLGALAAALRAWAAERLPDQELLAIDAKAIRSTVTGHDSAAQDFAALVSAYGAESGLVAAVRPYRNGHASEVGTTQALIADLADSLDLTGKTLSLDALHCTKKRSASSAGRERTTS